jgi:hypothetical protein
MAIGEGARVLNSIHVANPSEELNHIVGRGKRSFRIQVFLKYETPFNTYECM